MLLWIVQIAFIPLILVTAKLSLPHGWATDAASPLPLRGIVTGLVLGTTLISVGMWGCFFDLPHDLQQSHISSGTRLSADITKDPGTYWFIIFISYLGSYVLALTGYILVRLAIAGVIHRPIWKESHNKLRCHTATIQCSAEINTIAKAIVIQNITPNRSHLTPQQLQHFLWQTKQQFPEHQIWLPRAPNLDALVSALSQSGNIKLDMTVQRNHSSHSFIRQVVAPTSSPFRQLIGIPSASDKRR